MANTPQGQLAACGQRQSWWTSKQVGRVQSASGQVARRWQSLGASHFHNPYGATDNAVTALDLSCLHGRRHTSSSIDGGGSMPGMAATSVAVSLPWHGSSNIAGGRSPPGMEVAASATVTLRPAWWQQHQQLHQAWHSSSISGGTPGSEPGVVAWCMKMGSPWPLPPPCCPPQLLLL